MKIKKKTVKDIPHLSGKTVLLTVDFNVNLVKGKIVNETRITEALPTIKYLLAKGAKVVIVSHLGRPKGIDPNFSLRPVSLRLSKLINKPVCLIEKFWEGQTRSIISKTPKGSVVMLENIRFHEGEKKNDPIFSRHLASLADVFVNDAFAVSHRIHASTVGVAEILPSYAGLLMAKEVKMLTDALERPKRPFLVIIGGAKTPEKISVIERLLDIADTIALGGGIANTFLAAWGFGMGKSFVDYEMVEMARVVFWKASRKHSALVLPLDVIIADQAKKELVKQVGYQQVPCNVAIYDIGQKTRENYQNLIAQAKTIIWNGPMGYYEDRRFRQGNQSVIEGLMKSKARVIIGGGDTLTTIKSDKNLSQNIHISTGGSAMLAFLEKGTLPGIEVLEDKD